MKKDFFKKLISVFVTGLLFLSITGFSGVSYANNVSYNPTVNDFKAANEKNKEFVNQQNFEVLRDKALKNSQKLQAESEKKELEAIQTLKNDGVSILSIINVPKGTDTTFYSASEGKNDSSRSGIGNCTTSYDVTNMRELIGAWSAGIGTGNGWAWVGQRFDVTGSGSQGAYVRMNGHYKGSLLGSYTGSAHVKIMIKLYDATVGSYIGETTIYDETSTNNSQILKDDNFNNSIYATLTAGHEYVAYVITYGDVSEYGTFGSILEFGDPSYNQFTNYNYITVDWL